jgi:uncharacterized protein (TIGR02391 family)
MNLETRLDSRLWQAIQSSHEARNYTGAIIDAVYFLSSLIREKTGLESDGVALAGQAFGGKSPKLKVNKLQSESDWSVQNGIEQILRGIYQSIRNPRSHEKHTDTAGDAEAIIVFINYLVKTIDQSKAPFTKSDFLKRVFDEDFVETGRYADLLVNEIPAGQRLEVFIDVYRQKETGDAKKLRYFICSLLGQLKEEETSQVYQLVSEELRETDSDDTVRTVLQILPPSCWPHFEESARLRIENKLIKSVEEGSYMRETKKCVRGALGTWALSICEDFLLKDEFLWSISRKLLYGAKAEQDYIFQFFFHQLPRLADPPTPLMKTAMRKGLRAGDKRFYDGLRGLTIPPGCFPKSWEQEFKEQMDGFAEAEPTSEEGPADDIPF